MKRTIIASLIALVAVVGVIGCSSNTEKPAESAGAADSRAAVENPHKSGTANSTITLGDALTLTVPGSGAVEERTLGIPENTQYDIESANAWLYGIDGFALIATRVAYAEDTAPDLATVTENIGADTMRNKRVDSLGDITDMTVSGRPAKIFVVYFDENKDPEEFGRTVVIEEAPGVYWLVAMRSRLNDRIAGATFDTLVDSLAFAGE